MRLQSAIFTVEDTLAGHEDAAKVLSILKMEGVWLYAVTALAREDAERILRETGTAEDFRGLLTAGETHCPLDKGEIYAKAMRRLRSEQRDTIVFAGRLAGLRAAKRAGFRTAAVAGAADAAEWEEMCREAAETVENYRDFLA